MTASGAAVQKSVVVSGAGSGVGRAVARRMAREGWRVAALGRRADALDETASGAADGAIRPEPCDVGDAAAVARVRDRLLDEWGAMDAVVAAAGVNIRQRGWDVLTVEDFSRLVEVNLFGVFHLVHAFLPSMRRRGRGTIVAINSDNGLVASVKSGGGYVASKFGLTGLIESINAEMRGEGIRACGIFPGDINTPLLNERPTPPTAEARETMLQPDDIADCVMLAINLPARAIVEKLIVRPR